MQKIYPPESAGRILTKNVPLAFPDQTLFEARKNIFEKATEFETLNYVYVKSGLTLTEKGWQF